MCKTHGYNITFVLPTCSVDRASAQVEGDEYNSAKAGAVKTVNHDGTYLGVDCKG